MPSYPYNPISQYYQTLFGEKVYKISVSSADTCPNREGLRGMQTCNFCDVWGSAAYHKNLEKPLRDQIEKVRSVLIEKRKAGKFLVYFQAYTTTFQKVNKLREEIAIALDYPDVVGVVIGTRPDCISDSLLDLWNETSEKVFVSVEMGVQSFDEESLIWMRRGHTAASSLKAIKRISERCPKVDLGIHLIFGLPGETRETVIETARICNGLPIKNVKLHNLHVLKNTPLEEDFHAGKFVPMERETYFEHVGLFLRHLKPELAVHRLSAYAPRWDELVAPAWTSHKMKTYQDMMDYLIINGYSQGDALP